MPRVQLTKAKATLLIRLAPSQVKIDSIKTAEGPSVVHLTMSPRTTLSIQVMSGLTIGMLNLVRYWVSSFWTLGGCNSRASKVLGRRTTISPCYRTIHFTFRLVFIDALQNPLRPKLRISDKPQMPARQSQYLFPKRPSNTRNRCDAHFVP